ncbi:hypothetical protein GEMRC1_008488 [Eukaryota sp. GEM-RC1]
MFFDCVETSCPPDHPSILKFLNSISPENPKILILVQSLIKVVDVVFLATEQCTLMLPIKFDHVFPQSISNLFVDVAIIKEYVSSSCNLSELASFFFLNPLNSFIDRSLLLKDLLPDLFQFENFQLFQTSPTTVKPMLLSLLNDLKLPSHLKKHCNFSYQLVRGTFEFLKTHSNSEVPQSFLFEIPQVAVDVCRLMECQSGINPSQPISFVDSRLPVNPNDVIYRNDFLKTIVVSKDSIYPPSTDVLISFFISKNQCPKDKLDVFRNLQSALGLTITISPKFYRLTFTIGALNRLFYLERLMLKDLTFRQEFLNIDVTTFDPNVQLVQKKSVSESGTKSTVVVNVPFSDLFNLLKQLPSSYSWFFPHLKQWKISSSQCSFSVHSKMASRIKQLVELSGLNQWFDFDNEDDDVINDVIHDTTVLTYLQLVFKEFLQDHGGKFPKDSFLFGECDAFEPISRLKLNHDLLVTIASCFLDDFGQVDLWQFDFEHGCLVPVLNEMSKILGSAYTAMYDKNLDFNSRRNRAVDFIVFLLNTDNGLLDCETVIKLKNTNPIQGEWKKLGALFQAS